MLALLRRLLMLDRRVVYLLIVAVLSAPFVFTYTLPIHPDTYTRRFFEALERIAEDPVERGKVVLVLTNWGPGTRGENEPQFDVLIRHLLRRRLPFVLACTMGPPEFHAAALAALERAQLAELTRARRLGQPAPAWEYGVDYLDFGYKNVKIFPAVARTVITAPRAFFRQDYRHRKDLTDDASYPLLRRLHGAEDLSAVVVVSAGDESKYIAGLVRGAYPQLRIGAATMGIVANNLYPFVRSGQLFGLLNSARSATEYRALLNPDEPTTTPRDNAMSLGKTLLLLLVLLGNVALVTTRWAERTGRLAPPDPRRARPPLPPLPRWLMWTLFGLLVAGYAGTAAYEIVRTRPAGTEAWRPATAAQAAAPDPQWARLVQQHADLQRAKWIEARIGTFIAAFLTLGVFAFLLGDNRLYRFIEAIIMGGSLAYLLDQVDQILRPDWYEPIVAGLTGRAPWTHALWLLLIVPGALWYFTYSRRYRWLNQLIVAVFIGLMVGPEFRNQVNLLIPQVLDTIQPVWPWVPTAAGGRFDLARFEHLVFVVVAVLSLGYFIFFLRPRTPIGRGTLSAGRIALMIGFGIGFGNTVNTRLSWLADRIAFLLQDWLGTTYGG